MRQKIVYPTANKEFVIKSITSKSYGVEETAEVIFSEGVDFADVQTFYDTNRVAENLRRMEIYTEIEQSLETTGEGELATESVVKWELQGVHIGYTKPTDLSCFGGVVKVKVNKESPLESQVAAMQETIEFLVSQNQVKK